MSSQPPVPPLSAEEILQLKSLLGTEMKTIMHQFDQDKRKRLFGVTTEATSPEEKHVPQPTVCYNFFLDYMNCHKHVSNVLKQSQRTVLKLHEPDLKISSVCNKAYQAYEQCTHQKVAPPPPPSITDVGDDGESAGTAMTLKKALNTSTKQHFVQDFEYYHTSTKSVEQQIETTVGMLYDPILKQRLDDLQAAATASVETPSSNGTTVDDAATTERHQNVRQEQIKQLLFPNMTKSVEEMKNTFTSTKKIPPQSNEVKNFLQQLKNKQQQQQQEE